MNAGGWSTQIGLHDIGSEVTEFLRDDGERQPVFGVVHEFPHPLLGISVSQPMGAAALAQRLDAGARERRAEGVAAADIVALQVADAAVDDALGSVQAAGFEALGETVREQHLADQAALPHDGVEHAGPAGELHAFGGGAGEPRLATPVVGRLLVPLGRA